jgi:hypothetical protein
VVSLHLWTGNQSLADIRHVIQLMPLSWYSFVSLWGALLHFLSSLIIPQCLPFAAILELALCARWRPRELKPRKKCFVVISQDLSSFIGLSEVSYEAVITKIFTHLEHITHENSILRRL